MKTATFSMRMAPDKKQEMESFYAELGMSLATAVNIYFEHCIMAAGIPFDVKIDGEISSLEDLLNQESSALKTAQFSMRIDPYKKAQVDYTFKECGMTVSDGVNVFFEACLRTSGFPFRVGYPRPNKETMAAMREADDMLAGKIPAKRYKSWEEMKADIFAEDEPTQPADNPREDVLRRLNEFCSLILHTRLDKKGALEIKRQINEFCLANNVTVEERSIFISTGAGESLEMLCSIPDQDLS